jgi:hypothetical protein
MPKIFRFYCLAFLLLAAPTPCLALWSIADVTPERATELGIVVQSEAAGPKDLRVEMEFKPQGVLRGFDRVELRFGEGNDALLTVPLKEDRSQPERVTVNFSAERKQLAKISLWIMVPQSLGGVVYRVRLKDFAEVEEER